MCQSLEWSCDEAYNTCHDEELIHPGQSASNRPRRILTGVKWSDHAGCSDSNASDKSTSVQDSENPNCSGLHYGADDGEDSGDHQAFATTQSVRDESRTESPEKATCLESGDDVCFEIGGKCGILFGLGEVVLAGEG